VVASSITSRSAYVRVAIAVVGAAAETTAHAASSIAGRYSSRTAPAVSSCFIATSAQNEWTCKTFKIVDEITILIFQNRKISKSNLGSL
jgi:hypothetical protein